MLTLKPAFHITMKVGAIQEIGLTAKGRRRMIPIEGGHFSGDGMDGEVLPGGADWQLIRPDGVAEIAASYTLRTADGTVIYIVNRGYRHGPKEVMNQLAKGEYVAPESYYFRTTPVFEVESGPYEWLNRTLFIGVGERKADTVSIVFYEVP